MEIAVSKDNSFVSNDKSFQDHSDRDSGNKYLEPKSLESDFIINSYNPKSPALGDGGFSAGHLKFGNLNLRITGLEQIAETNQEYIDSRRQSRLVPNESLKLPEDSSYK